MPIHCRYRLWLISKVVHERLKDRRAADPAKSNSADDKVCALKQYRRVCGLCDRCAEKWSYGHQCSSTVQLHVIQEFWDLFQDEGLSAEKHDSEDNSICTLKTEYANIQALSQDKEQEVHPRTVT
jgi:hypothetical protein